MYLTNAAYLVLFLFSVVNETATFDLCTEDDPELESYSSRNFASQACGCNRTLCIRKCCKPQFYLRKKFCIRNNSSDEFVVPVYNKEVLIDDVRSNHSFLVGVMENCTILRMKPADPKDAFYLQNDGTVWVPRFDKIFHNDEYCVDGNGDDVTAFLCFPETQNERKGIANTVGMIISMPFLLATLVVYAVLPESNIHRKALMFYVFTLLMAYIFLVTIQLNVSYVSPVPCKFLGYSVIFFFTGSFFWMNVMCIDMWLAFSGIRGFGGQKSAERTRFLLYSLYALGMPTLLVITTVLLDAYGDPDNPNLPGVGHVKCFLNEGLPVLYYFYGPVALITTFNIILFILTAIKIQRVKKETSMLKHSDSKRHSYEDDKQKFNLYLKLLFAMGVNWSMEVISWAVQWKLEQVPSYVWYLTDFCNAMYGVFIFFIFVFKKKIWKTLQKRYYIFIGKPHLAHSLTTTQTTRSMSTTDTGINDQNMRELPKSKEERSLTQNF